MNKSLKIGDQEESFKLLHVLETDSNITQRELSKRIDLSLGKINFLLSSLIKSGYLKVKRFKNSKQKRAYLYVLTPKGMKQKTIMAQDFLHRKIEEYNRLKKEIQDFKSAANGNKKQHFYRP